MSLSRGLRLGRYEIRAPLGEGGMGEVYLAWDEDLEREVALKVLRGEGEESAERVRRFVQEAKAASALNHPNVATVYEIGSVDGLRFIAMEVVEGDTLRRRIDRGEIPLDDVLSIGTQVAGALAAAHTAGIIHRDIKPENVILRPDGYAKVLDFGLAKLFQLRPHDAETVMRTQTGVVMGTLRYMAPEQLGGSDVTPAADVFSLGVVLYEMVSGRRPFEGNTPTEIATGILTKSPEPLVKMRQGTPPRLAAVIDKALAKDPAARYPTAVEMLEELKQITRETMSPVDLDLITVIRPKHVRRAAVVAAVLFLIVAAVTVTLLVRRSQRIARANAIIAAAQRLVAQHSYADAFDLASKAAKLVPRDERVRALMATTSTRATFESEPTGATVFLQRFKGDPVRLRVGTTPLKIARLARADYIVMIEKSGFAPAVRPLSLAPGFVRDFEIPGQPADLRVKLVDARRVPSDMLVVEGGPYRLAGWSRPTNRAVDLRDFLIDRYEVSNREFETFVRDGGYRRRELWKHPFLLNGRSLSVEEAMALFHDTTGLPGPRKWVGGAPPAGKENHPVSGVTWYEAAAFAEWKGRTLPTVFQWEKAARSEMRGSVGTAMPWGVVAEGIDVAERANFRGKGTMPVDSLPFGLGPSGAYQMAGNVAEWCLNASGPGFVVRGGGWNDAVYTFGRTGSRPPFYASDTVGFRCVKELTPGGDSGSFALSPSVVVPTYQPVDDAKFKEIAHLYEYAKTPLNVRIVETVETPDWRRQKIVYNVGGKAVPAYLYLPKGYHGRLQVIHFAPAGDVAGGFRALPDGIESSLGPLIRGGRAVFSVVGEGFIERPFPAEWQTPDSRSDQYADYVIAKVTELRRGLDYLETRRDIDVSRIAFIGPSAGSWAGVILTALEPRYRSVLFIGTDLLPEEVTDVAAANRINFVPRIACPKMMMQGRYDESAPFETAAMPLYRLLREPKRLEVFEGSHVPPIEIAVPAMTKWLDETLGPVGR